MALASIRLRVVAGYVALLAVALAVAVLVTRQVQLARLDRDIRRELAQEVEELRVLAGEGIDPRTGQPLGEDVERILDTFLERNVPSDNEAFYTIVGGQPYRRSFNAPAELFDDAELLAAWTSARAGDDGDVRHRGRRDPLPGRPDDDERGERSGRRLRRRLVPGRRPGRDRPGDPRRHDHRACPRSPSRRWSRGRSPGACCRPVRQLTRTARRISGSDLTARIPVEGHDELAELGETFNEMVSRLDEGFRAQRRFLDDVAHELRTPITIARGHLEMLGDDPNERAETVAIVTDELDRMSRYVTDLLILAKAEQPEFLDVRPVDLGELATGALQRVKALASRRWVLDQAPPVGTVATLADPDRLEQALVNLAANAAQHTSDGDEIGVGVATDGEHARLWVRDTGPGVDGAIAESLFKRYSRGAASRASRPEGTGIGLSIVDAIARAHGGASLVISTPGAGATFTMTIPLTIPLTTPPRRDDR